MNGKVPDDLPTWVKAVRDIGVPAAALFWLLYWLPSMNQQLQLIVELLRQHLAQSVR